MATTKWTVKDVVAHMVGWERGDAETIKQCWETKNQPWWKGVDKSSDDAFNAKWVEFYKDYTPEQLIIEWETWQCKVREIISQIGEQNLKTRMDLFAWLFEGVDDNRSDGKSSHYKHHYQQIKEALDDPK